MGHHPNNRLYEKKAELSRFLFYVMKNRAKNTQQAPNRRMI